jgi:hypothetical protein
MPSNDPKPILSLPWRIALWAMGIVILVLMILEYTSHH